MKKHTNRKSIIKRTHFLMMVFLLLVMSNMAFAQTLSCTSTTTLPRNATITVNTVDISTSYTGSVVANTVSGSSCAGISFPVGTLWLGNPTATSSLTSYPFTFTLTFNKPVNNLVLSLHYAGLSIDEDFTFVSDGGAVSLYSDAPAASACDVRVSGNTMYSGVNKGLFTAGGGGKIRVSAPNNFKTLTISGTGKGLGTGLQICSTSVVAQATITSITPATQSVCQDVTPSAITAAATGVGTLSYQWYSNTTNNNLTGTLISGATSASYTPPASATIGTVYYYVRVTDNNGSSNSSTVQVTSTACPPTINSITPATQSVCQNVAPSAITVTAKGATSYQWYSNTANNTTTGTLISGATSGSYTPPTTATVGTIYYYVRVTNANGSANSSTVQVSTIVCCNAGSVAPVIE